MAVLEGRARVYVTDAGEQGQAVRLAPPGSAVGMETSLVGPAGNAAALAEGSGPIDKLDAKSLEVSHYCTCSTVQREVSLDPVTM